MRAQTKTLSDQRVRARRRIFLAGIFSGVAAWGVTRMVMHTLEEIVIIGLGSDAGYSGDTGRGATIAAPLIGLLVALAVIFLGLALLDRTGSDDRDSSNAKRQY